MKPLFWMQRGRLMDPEPEPGGDGAPAFDPVKFKADLLAEFKKLLPKEPPRVEPKTEPEPEPEPKDGKKSAAELKFERELAKLRGELDTEKKARGEATEQARKEKRLATLTNELGKLGVPPERIKSALRAVDPDVKFDDTGALVGEDDTPLGDYLATWIKGNEHFLPPKNVSGTGATAGARQGSKAFDSDSIKPGMKAEDRQAARDQIAAVLRGQ